MSWKKTLENCHVILFNFTTIYSQLIKKNNIIENLFLYNTTLSLDKLHCVPWYSGLYTVWSKYLFVRFKTHNTWYSTKITTLLRTFVNVETELCNQLYSQYVYIISKRYICMTILQKSKLILTSQYNIRDRSFLFNMIV